MAEDARDPMYAEKGKPVNGVIHLVDQVSLVTQGKPTPEVQYRLRALTTKDGLIVEVGPPTWR